MDTPARKPESNGSGPVLRDSRGRFLRGSASPSPGRPPGSLGRVQRSLKQAMELAFENLGAEAWLMELARTEPTTFAALLSKLLPQAKDEDATRPVVLQVIAFDPPGACIGPGDPKTAGVSGDAIEPRS